MKYSKIKENDIANGPGVNVSLWTQGCPHKCKGCFNPETWSYEAGNEFTEVEKDYIFSVLDKNNVHRNLSILGGEPLCDNNVLGVLEFLKEFKTKFNNKLVYLWTGYKYENLTGSQKEVLKYVDYLIDGLFIEEQKNLMLQYRGSTNQRIINVQPSLRSEKVIEKIFDN